MPPNKAMLLGAREKRLLRESLFIVGALFLVYAVVSLFSYNANDISFSNSGDGSDDAPANAGGVVGAYLSAALLELFGYSAFVLCAVAALFWRQMTTRLLRPPLLEEESGRFGALFAALGLLMSAAASAAFERLRFADGGDLPAGSGGYVGALVGDGMQTLFGVFGASLLLLSIWLLGLSLALGLSWIGFLEKIGMLCEGAGKALVGLAARRKRQKQEAAKAPAPPPPPATTAEDLPPPPPPPAPPPPKNAAGVGAAEPQFFGFQKLRQKAGKANKKEKKENNSAAAASEAGDDEERQPGFDLLDVVSQTNRPPDEDLRATAKLIEESLASFNVRATVEGFHSGPVITRYDLQPASGVKGAQIVGLGRDLARALSVSSVRVLETLPGTNYIGLEIPNPNRSAVGLLEVLSSPAWQSNKAVLPLALGQTAAGAAAVADLANMPHLLVAGSTGSGKSVFVNAVLLSLLFSRAAKELRLILVDPKMLELAMYADIPHLLAPVVTDMAEAPAALNWAVAEMENRYRLMAFVGARHIASFNEAAAGGKARDEDGEVLQPMPFIVVVIDELADLMMVAGKKIEISISRLAQKARAAGIHLILATQRPSVDVITGLIKANVPCRISFQVASKVDSRTILDQMGAETLLGKGDMLYLPPGSGAPRRLHGAFVSDDEVRRVVEHVRANNEKPEYTADFAGIGAPPAGGGLPGAGEDGGGEADPLYDEATRFVVESQRVSVSLVQRKLRIGYNRAARIVEDMEKAGVVSQMNEAGARKVLAPRR